MCTCGIDIATQHATPATHSSACAWSERQAERPLRRLRGRRSRGAAPPTAAGGRGRMQRARAAACVSDAEHAEADVGLAPADRLDEVLDDRRPDRAGEVVAARADRDRDAAPAHEPERGVGDQRREGRRAAEQRRSARRARARTSPMLPRMPAATKPAPSPSGADQRAAPSRRSGRRAGPSACRRRRSRPSAACRAARRRRARRRTRPAPRAARPRRRTCRSRRSSSAPA